MKFFSPICPASLLMLLGIASCSKEGSYDPAINGKPGIGNKLKMYIEDARNSPLNEIDSFLIAYDANNRITSLTAPKLKEAYAYGNNNSFTLDLYTMGALSVHEIAFVNSNALVDSSFQYNDAHDSTTEGYAYSGKLLMSKKTYAYTMPMGSRLSMREDYSYDQLGNMIKDIQSDSLGNVNLISNFTYTSKLLNYSIGPIYFPVLSRYLPATQSQADGSGNAIAKVNYSYAFDVGGRIVKETDSVDNGEVFIKDFIYY